MRKVRIWFICESASGEILGYKCPSFSTYFQNTSGSKRTLDSHQHALEYQPQSPNSRRSHSHSNFNHHIVEQNRSPLDNSQQDIPPPRTTSPEDSSASGDHLSWSLVNTAKCVYVICDTSSTFIPESSAKAVRAFAPPTTSIIVDIYAPLPSLQTSPRIRPKPTLSENTKLIWA